MTLSQRLGWLLDWASEAFVAVWAIVAVLAVVAGLVVALLSAVGVI